VQKEGEDWMRKRGLEKKHSSNRKNIEFAKNLFLSWDDDGSGVLEAAEIIRPLISLGLSCDSKFAIKILQALDPGWTPDKDKDDLKITLKDFIKIFNSDKLGDRIVSLINKEIEENKPEEHLSPMVLHRS
jgi:hypothetical protein